MRCVKYLILGGRHSSVVLSAPTILWPWVRIPSTPSNLLSVCIICNCNEKRTKINKKRLGLAHFLKNKKIYYQHSIATLLNKLFMTSAPQQNWRLALNTSCLQPPWSLPQIFSLIIKNRWADGGFNCCKNSSLSWYTKMSSSSE